MGWNFLLVVQVIFQMIDEWNSSLKHFDFHHSILFDTHAPCGY